MGTIIKSFLTKVYYIALYMSIKSHYVYHYKKRLNLNNHVLGPKNN